MTDVLALATLERLRSVDWPGEWEYALEHPQSRRLLMREYLRRAALWAQEYGAEAAWPFFDVTGYTDPNFQLPPEIATELDGLLNTVASSTIGKTCSGAVRLAALRASDATIPDLPDLYEPLLLFYERGGEFLADGAGFLDLTGVSIQPRSLQDNLAATPLPILRTTTLDAMDAEGRITYYAEMHRSDSDDAVQHVARRRLTHRGQKTHDETFTEDLRWEPTQAIRLAEQGERGAAYAPISDASAANLIEEIMKMTLKSQ
ncbi:hypothetical protein ACWGH2_28755 [Streptomyces sp. NPDC054871]